MNTPWVFLVLIVLVGAVLAFTALRADRYLKAKGWDWVVFVLLVPVVFLHDRISNAGRVAFVAIVALGGLWLWDIRRRDRTVSERVARWWQARPSHDGEPAENFGPYDSEVRRFIERTALWSDSEWRRVARRHDKLCSSLIPGRGLRRMGLAQASVQSSGRAAERRAARMAASAVLRGAEWDGNEDFKTWADVDMAQLAAVDAAEAIVVRDRIPPEDLTLLTRAFEGASPISRDRDIDTGD